MFAQTSPAHNPETPFIIVSSLESTNNYAMAKLHAGSLISGSCIMAKEQTAGRGQRGKEWLSAPGKNITMSIILPSFAYPAFPFAESAVIALSCYEFIKDAGVENISIKWPNDLYIGDRKAAGILVENVYRGAEWRHSIAGIGMNVNQTEFAAGASRACSLKQVTNREFNVPSLAKDLHQKVIARIHESMHSSPQEIMKEYNSVLYRRGKQAKLKLGSAVFPTTIDGVSLSGELLTHDTLDRSFAVGEVEFVGANA